MAFTDTFGGILLIGICERNGEPVVQERMSIIAWLTLLPAGLLITAPHCGAATRVASGVAPVPYVQSEGARGTTQLLAQNQPPKAAAPDKSQDSGDNELDLNDQVIRDVFGPLQRAMEAHNLYQVLAVFDQQGTPDYAQVRDQLRAFFYQHDAIRFQYQLLQVTSDKDQGSAVADIQMDATPADPSQVTLRRETQMRFRMKLGPKGWRLVGFSPGDFFAQ